MVHATAPFYSTLIRINPANPSSTTDFVCDLCTGMPEPGDGGKTYTFELRDGVKFSDGVALKWCSPMGWPSSSTRKVQLDARSAHDAPMASAASGQAQQHTAAMQRARADAEAPNGRNNLIAARGPYRLLVRCARAFGSLHASGGPVGRPWRCA